MLDNDEVIISFDATSLYTNVLVIKAIEKCAYRLYSGDFETPPLSKETFVKLGTSNVLLSTHNGLFWQMDGLAMGSQPAPPISTYGYRIMNLTYGLMQNCLNATWMTFKDQLRLN